LRSYYWLRHWLKLTNWSHQLKLFFQLSQTDFTFFQC
jgi:hypothetical protein